MTLPVGGLVPVYKGQMGAASQKGLCWSAVATLQRVMKCSHSPKSFSTLCPPLLLSSEPFRTEP